MFAMRVSEFDYQLPEDLIAQHPAANRTASRLLRLDAPSGSLADLDFADFPGLVGEGDLIVVNDTRVIKARLSGRKASGGQVELFIERLLGADEALALVRASHPPRPGSVIRVGDAVEVEVLGREDDLYRLRFRGQAAVAVLERHGELPLPPYVHHTAQAEDEERYQTVYASRPGAVAAPTAGLHFDRAMLESLVARGARIARVTLHVGAGTFQPVRTEEVEAHRMHSERYEVPVETFEAIEATRARGGRVLAVGTTTLRALESAAKDGRPAAGSGETRLFITPGFAFRVVDRLLTNFHLPRSSLLMLVSAFAGLDNVRRAYSHAIAARYRFFSYGDAMLIERLP